MAIDESKSDRVRTLVCRNLLSFREFVDGAGINTSQGYYVSCDDLTSGECLETVQDGVEATPPASPAGPVELRKPELRGH